MFWKTSVSDISKSNVSVSPTMFRGMWPYTLSNVYRNMCNFGHDELPAKLMSWMMTWNRVLKCCVGLCTSDRQGLRHYVIIVVVGKCHLHSVFVWWKMEIRHCRNRWFVLKALNFFMQYTLFTCRPPWLPHLWLEQGLNAFWVYEKSVRNAFT